MKRKYKVASTETPLYFVWQSMKVRCYKPNSRDYKNYGGRGVIVCERWLESFDNFYDDLHKTYKKGLSLDRIDNNGNYEPSNCRWTTQFEQSNNQRTYSTNISGYKGVNWHATARKWRAEIDYYGKRYYLGLFSDKDEAGKKVKEFREQLKR